MKQYEGFPMPSSPADQLKLAQMLNEVVNSMTRSRAEASHKRETIKSIKEEFGIPTGQITAAASILFNENLDEVKAKAEDLEQLVSIVTDARRKARIGGVVAVSSDSVPEDDSEE